MKKFFVALMIAVMTVSGLTVFAEGQDKNAKMEKYCERILERIKQSDPSKYEEISKITDVQKKFAACRVYMSNAQLEKIKTSNPEKYEELMKLKSSNPKEYQKELRKALKEMNAGKKKSKKKKS